MTAKETQERRRKQGLCPICGDEIDDKNYKVCSFCRKLQRNYYLRRKNGCDWHDCDTCPHDDCIKSDYESNKFIISRRKSNRKSKNKTRIKRIKNKICVLCGKPLNDSNIQTCKKCTLYRKELDHKLHLIKMKNKVQISDFLCKRCHKKEKIEGKEVCKDCYNILITYLSHAWIRNKTEECKKHWKDDYKRWFKN